jgi:hypothetical protein
LTRISPATFRRLEAELSFLQDELRQTQEGVLLLAKAVAAAKRGESVTLPDRKKP